MGSQPVPLGSRPQPPQRRHRDTRHSPARPITAKLSTVSLNGAFDDIHHAVVRTATIYVPRNIQRRFGARKVLAVQLAHRVKHNTHDPVPLHSIKPMRYRVYHADKVTLTIATPS